ncbi:MAG: NADPH-dependent 7-cyano-7-deazaguanine reductase QueF [Candidatus Magasanikbacteria bacterium]|nr:NADPH-dependent 7-cyano-7-deazaguanine reductase QueF [Candidatus Magasanikbacteria bacterium]
MPTTKKDLKKLKKLGRSAKPSRTLEVFPNHAGENMTVSLDCKEFTCKCPLTGQPDYAHILLTYTPDKYVVESKSMKLYLESYRDTGVFHEHLAVDIAKDFITYVQPLSLSVLVSFNVRGGISISADYHWNR